MDPKFAILYLDTMELITYAVRETFKYNLSRARSIKRAHSHYRLTERRGGRMVWTHQQTSYFDGV